MERRKIAANSASRNSIPVILVVEKPITSKPLPKSDDFAIVPSTLASRISVERDNHDKPILILNNGSTGNYQHDSTASKRNQHISVDEGGEYEGNAAGAGMSADSNVLSSWTKASKREELRAPTTERGSTVLVGDPIATDTRHVKQRKKFGVLVFPRESAEPSRGGPDVQSNEEVDVGVEGAGSRWSTASPERSRSGKARFVRTALRWMIKSSFVMRD